MNARWSILVSLIALTLAAGCDGSDSDNGPGAANASPVADAGGDQVVEKGDRVALDGAGSWDPEGDRIVYRWTQIQGTPVSLDDPSYARPFFTAPDTGGELWFSLVVSDATNDSSPDSVMVDVENHAPVADAGRDVTAEGDETVALDGTASMDPDGDVLVYAWTQVAGEPVTLVGAAGATPSFLAPVEGGLFEFSLTVTDVDGAATSDSVRADVAPGVVDLPPTADAGRDVEIPKRVDTWLRGSAVDPEQQLLTVAWVQTAGEPTTIVTPDQLNTLIKGLPVEADLEFELRVDDGSHVATDRVSVSIRNTTPVVVETGLAPTAPGTLDTLTVSPTVLNEDRDELTMTYRWQVNGEELADQTGDALASEHYVKGDVITATVTADDGQESDTLDENVTVVDTPAVLSVDQPPTVADYGKPLSFQLLVDDPDGDTLDDFELAHGPIGMNVDASGLVTWTPGGPMFALKLDVSWLIGSAGDPTVEPVGGSIEVRDPARKYPLRRSGIEIPIWSDGLEVGDFDNDGEVEALVASARSVYELGIKGNKYVQQWMYPFLLGDQTIIGAIGAADVDGDAAAEIFVAAGTMVTQLAGKSRRVSRKTGVPDDHYCRDLELADIDLDGATELVCLGFVEDWLYAEEGAAFVFDAVTLEFEWRTPLENVGSTLAVGNVDEDPGLEIVLAGGSVYDAVTRTNQWTASTPFGSDVDVGDIDGDGIDEIVGATAWSTAGLKALDGVTKAVLWQIEVDDIDALTVADIQDDPRAEILLGDGQWGDVTAYRHNPVGSPSVLFRINSQNHGVSTIDAGDLDGDGAIELIWGSGESSSGENTLVVSSVGPDPVVEWKNANPAELDGPFFGGLAAETAPERTTLIFAVGRTDSGYGDARVISLSPQGRVALTKGLGSNANWEAAVDVADVDSNGVDEVLLCTSEGYDGYFTAVDFRTSESLWTSPQDIGVGVAVTHADLNGDDAPEFIAMTREGIIKAYDMMARTLYWQSPKLEVDGGVDVVVADLDADDRLEIYGLSLNRLVRFDYSESAGQYVETAFYLVDEAVDLVAGDIDGDGLGELFLLYGEWSLPSKIQRYDSDFLTGTMFELHDAAHGLFIEDYGDGRKNLLAAIAKEDDGFRGTRTTLVAVDADTGAEVWRSPNLPGSIPKNSVHYVDLSGGGVAAMAFGTTYGMYMTR